MSANKVILVGRLTRDPEVKYTQTGMVIASFTIAVDRFSNGKKEADFIPIVSFGKTAEACGNNISKGSKVLVDGRIQVRNYQDKNGQKKYVTEVIGNQVEFLDSRASMRTGEHLRDEDVLNEPEIFPDDDVPF